MRILALSDLHVDFEHNGVWIDRIASRRRPDDVLLVAGDVSDDLERLGAALGRLRESFAEVVFVPGNHDLWVRKQAGRSSLDKFHMVLERCEHLGVRTGPVCVGSGDARLWVVPLFSWYALPDEDDTTLYVDHGGPDNGLSVWSDTYFVKWPTLSTGDTPARYFAGLNLERVARSYDAPVITMSHFLPRREVMFQPGPRPSRRKRVPFNFSRVAGCSLLERQLRRLGSRAHVYGHQHRNRDRSLEGVRYVSNCLGYLAERQSGALGELNDEPKEVWSL